MADQVIDKITVGIPGPTGDVTPAATAARDQAVDAASRAETFSATTETLQRGAVETILEEAVPEARLGTGSVRLREIVGNGGNRILLESTNTADPDIMPYFEVRAASGMSDVGGAVGGFQIAIVGDGTTPVDQPRLYFFIEAHDLTGSNFDNRDDSFGFIEIGVSSRAGVSKPPVVFGVGGRRGLALHGEKPYIELLRNTAIVLDDRQRGTTAPGSLHEDHINLRRVGPVGIRMTSFGSVATTAPSVKLARNRGTSSASTLPQENDILGAVHFGTLDTVQEDRPDQDTFAGGTFIRGVAREAWTSTAHGSRLEFNVAAIGSVNRDPAMILLAPDADGRTSMQVAVMTGTTVRRLQVVAGPADSGGSGYRMLRIPNQ